MLFCLQKRNNRYSSLKSIQSIDCNANSPLDMKLYTLEKLYGKYNVHIMCEALQVSRGTFYNHILRNKRDNTWYATTKVKICQFLKQKYTRPHRSALFL